MENKISTREEYVRNMYFQSLDIWDIYDQLKSDDVLWHIKSLLGNELEKTLRERKHAKTNL